MSGRARQLHGSPWQGVFHLTGGGADFLAEALGAPGASQTVLEARIPYAKPALAELLRTAPRQACNAEVARALAMAAFQRAAALQRAAAPAQIPRAAASALASGMPDAPPDNTAPSTPNPARYELASGMLGAPPASAPPPQQAHDGKPAEQETPQLFGFGGTASLATNRIKRGSCRAHLAVQTRTHTFCGEIALQGDRANQEQALTEAAWEILQNALGLTHSAPDQQAANAQAHSTQADIAQASSAGRATFPRGAAQATAQAGIAQAGSAEAGMKANADAAGAKAGGASGSRLALQSAQAPQDWQDLVTGRQRRIQTAPHDGLLLLPGAFNPLHDGHHRMMAHAEAKLGRAGAFELSIENPDKPMLDYLSIRDRLAQFQLIENPDKPVLDYLSIRDRLAQFRHPVWLTRLPRFLEKARHFPGATFALGTDTLMRIADPRYYGSARERDRQLAKMLDLGTRFLVFGRLINGTFRCLSDCPLPRPLCDACIEVPQEQFRLDISSTELRERNAKASR